ncbi:hypothetical protein N7452_008600 [Penicillium brevicompactum]|uniref:Uncharacterized protein n=1 Tax=Penicillium brevicompactum TaxID=5074 RepID=A0A9W9Q7A8_PENBR|nr:hypothetical protein N7452_008600 [Penicillium brevicompactum]
MPLDLDQDIAPIPRSREENQERAFIAASRRKDRSLDARLESANRASMLHKKRTGKAFHITKEIVEKEAMYEEVDERYQEKRIKMLQAQNMQIEEQFHRHLLEAFTKRASYSNGSSIASRRASNMTPLPSAAASRKMSLDLSNLRSASFSQGPGSMASPIGNNDGYALSPTVSYDPHSQPYMACMNGSESPYANMVPASAATPRPDPCIHPNPRLDPGPQLDNGAADPYPWPNPNRRTGCANVAAANDAAGPGARPNASLQRSTRLRPRATSAAPGFSARPSSPPAPLPQPTVTVAASPSPNRPSATCTFSPRAPISTPPLSLQRSRHSLQTLTPLLISALRLTPPVSPTHPAQKLESDFVSGELDPDYTDFSQFALNLSSDMPHERDQPFGFDDFLAVDEFTSVSC